MFMHIVLCHETDKASLKGNNRERINSLIITVLLVLFNLIVPADSRKPCCDAFAGSGDPGLLQKPSEETVHAGNHGDRQEAAGEEE